MKISGVNTQNSTPFAPLQQAGPEYVPIVNRKYTLLQRFKTSEKQGGQTGAMAPLNFRNSRVPAGQVLP